MAIYQCTKCEGMRPCVLDNGSGQVLDTPDGCPYGFTGLHEWKLGLKMNVVIKTDYIEQVIHFFGAMCHELPMGGAGISILLKAKEELAAIKICAL